MHLICPLLDYSLLRLLIAAHAVESQLPDLNRAEGQLDN
jgi:hypothetical protein